jgi:hypothetical protein
MEIGYIRGRGIWYPTELRTIRKKEELSLQPIFEAFTNSLEAIRIQKNNDSSAGNGEIIICLYLVKDLFSKETNKLNFQKITVEDSGIGFNNTEFERFINLRDDRKNFSNKGTGRVQLIHFFDKSVISSIYKDEKSSTGFKKRVITLSKNEAFLKQNAIVRLDSEEEIMADTPSTIIRFENLLDSKEFNYYSVLTSGEIKQELIRHYLAGFCEIRKELPNIIIKTILDDKDDTTLTITSDDIPIPDKEQPIDIFYSKVIDNNIEKTSNKETFNLKSFLINESKLDKNGLKLVSKGEIAKELKMNDLLPNDQINGNRYLFLLSGKYIEERDSDTRGEINIPLKKDFKRRNTDSFLSEEEILLEDIEEKTNQTIVSIYKEIEEKNKEREKSINELQTLFLLNPKTIKSLRNKINIDDTDASILRKVYEADAKIVAEKDAEIKQQLNELESLTPDNKDYQDLLKNKVNEFVKAIPLQNRTSLTRYVARRKIVLELFQKILDKELEKLRNGGRIDEDLMHNLIFQQTSSNPENSDLWLINEEFIYFKGCSEKPLNQVEIDGEKIFKKEFTAEEERYLTSLGENRKTKRPDILLFPEEGKCIIIELKAPEVNASDHLMQIDSYANLILNYTEEKFYITTFYGYLIGESIEPRDVLGKVGRYEHSCQFDYFYRPAEKVNGFDGRPNGSIYTEVIKYSTLLNRAKLRNKIFIDKLEKDILTQQ